MEEIRLPPGSLLSALDGESPPAQSFRSGPEPHPGFLQCAICSVPRPREPSEYFMPQGASREEPGCHDLRCIEVLVRDILEQRRPTSSVFELHLENYFRVEREGGAAQVSKLPPDVAGRMDALLGYRGQGVYVSPDGQLQPRAVVGEGDEQTDEQPQQGVQPTVGHIIILPDGQVELEECPTIGYHDGSLRCNCASKRATASRGVPLLEHLESEPAGWGIWEHRFRLTRHHGGELGAHSARHWRRFDRQARRYAYASGFATADWVQQFAQHTSFGWAELAVMSDSGPGTLGLTRA